MTTTQTSMPERHPQLHPLRGILIIALTVLVVAGIVAAFVSSRGVGTTDSADLVQGSGIPATELRDVEPFTSVDLAGSNNVFVTVGDEQGVRVFADDNLLTHVTTDVRSGELVIGNRGSFRARSPMRVVITIPALHGVTLDGSGNLTAEGVDTTFLTVRLNAGGSGVVRVSGRADRVEAILAGSGELRLEHLVASEAAALVSGSGTIRVHATRALDALVSGSGTIRYSGNPRLTESVTGSGAIIG